MKKPNPFPGLRPFEANESHLFFGREAATDELLQKLQVNCFIAVVGISGSGKSSLVRAGMLPDLYGGFMTTAGSRWRIAVLRPGDVPIRALAQTLTAPAVFGTADEGGEMQTDITEAVLRRGALGLIDVARQAKMPSDENLLVVVDQFEELFRLRYSNAGVWARDEPAAFVKLLLEATRQNDLSIYVVLTMRSEYLGDCTQFSGLPEAINAGQYLIPRMTRTQRREAVTGPAAVGGAAMTPRLIQRLLNDVGDNPDQLPILQHALMRTWDYWAATEPEGEAIDLGHYEAIGGMAEALSRHADEAFNELPDDASKEIAERLFKRLTGKGEYNREMRFPTRLGELCTAIGAEETQVIAIAEVFHREGRSFLMPPPEVPLTAESLLDISHESLIRIWRRLSGWVDEEGQSARIYRRLAETSALYKERQAGLWRDPDLQIALRWRKQNRPNETWAQRYHPGFADAIRFLDKSQAAARRRKLFKILPIVLLPLVWIGFLQTKTISLEKKTISLKKKNENLKEEFGKAVDDLNESQLKTLPSTESASTPSETRGESEQAAVVSEATNEVTQGAASSVSEVRLVTCRDVRKLEPIDIGTEFEPGRIFVFARLKVTKDETLTLRWYRAGQQKSFASSKIKARNNAGHFYKNFTWKNINKEGTYEIRLYDQNRNLIRSQVFKII